MKGNFQLGSALCLAVVASVVLLGMEASGGKEPSAQAQARTDIISIDAAAKFGPLEEGKVVYLHDRHTEALAKSPDWSKKGCFTCHPKGKDGAMSIKFMRLEDTSKAAVRDTYHANCVTCHADMAASGQKSGPTEAACRECHSSADKYVSARREMVVNQATHFRHAKHYDTSENKCGACHHVWDEKTRKTVAASKPEAVPGACVYCHKEEPARDSGTGPDKARSLRYAAHEQCVTCHLENQAKGAKDVGPVVCSGCHSAESQEKIAQTNAKLVQSGADLTIKRGQPEAALVWVALPEAKQGKKVPGTAGPVPFNHALHEKEQATCRSCHHASLQACGECHTLAGSPKGGGVPLEQAMHKVDASMSCVGCHAKRTEDKSCAGCHEMMARGQQSSPKAAPADCAHCHVKVDDASGLKGASQADVKTLAAKLVKDQPRQAAVMPASMLNDVPDKVEIKTLTDKNEPALFEHRKHVTALLKGTKDSALAAAFHDQWSACGACHHNSPAAKNPPSCASCHKATGHGDNPARPGLQAAYHGQCISCHQSMGIEGKVMGEAGSPAVPKAVDCAGCHKEKNKTAQAATK